MRKLIESTLVSLDGVIEAPERWANFDDEATALALTELGNFDALVMGRVTFEMLSAYWGASTGDPLRRRHQRHAQACGVAIADRDGMERDPPRTRRIQRDRRLKDQPGKDFIKYGTSRLDETLVRDRLIDEFRFWIMPVVVGGGRRLFEDVDASSLNLRLTHERRLANGSVILTFACG